MIEVATQMYILHYINEVHRRIEIQTESIALIAAKIGKLEGAEIKLEPKPASNSSPVDSSAWTGRTQAGGVPNRLDAGWLNIYWGNTESSPGVTWYATKAAADADAEEIRRPRYACVRLVGVNRGENL